MVVPAYRYPGLGEWGSKRRGLAQGITRPEDGGQPEGRETGPPPSHGAVRLGGRGPPCLLSLCRRPFEKRPRRGKFKNGRGVQFSAAPGFSECVAFMFERFPLFRNRTTCIRQTRMCFVQPNERVTERTCIRANVTTTTMTGRTRIICCSHRMEPHSKNGYNNPFCILQSS